MGRKATGTTRILNNVHGEPQWHAKWTRADGTRSDWEPLSPSIALTDVAGAKLEAARLAPKVKQASANGGKGETVADYAKRWLEDREGRLSCTRDDRSRLRDHVLPELGHLGATAFTRDDVERVRDQLDDKIAAGVFAWKTAACVWTLVTSMCGDMVAAKRREFRIRDDNPCRDVKPPERGARKSKQFLHPDEFLQVMACPEVPLRWRRAIALAVYTFTRDGELRALRWDEGDVDLAHGTLSVTRAFNERTGKVESTKTADTRRFAIEANLLPLLDAMHREAKGKGSVVGFHEVHMSRSLRRHLWRANVRRPELHVDTPTRKALTWHDLRATGLTWMAVRGDDALKIQQRAGHSTFSTTQLYVRLAESVRQGFGGLLSPGGG